MFGLLARSPKITILTLLILYGAVRAALVGAWLDAALAAVAGVSCLGAALYFEHRAQRTALELQREYTPREAAPGQHEPPAV